MNQETTVGVAAPSIRPTRPRLSMWSIWNMCVGFFGIQIGFGLQNANTSRIFQTLGAEIDSLAILWIAAPVTGLLVQPLVGYFSDKTWGRMGRRRPYFLFGALLTSAALVLMPNSPTLWFAAAMLWIMDASINITMEPFRAFIGDNLPDEQRTQGFAMQSFFIGTGAVFASVLPWLLSNVFGLASTAEAGVVPFSVKVAFYVGAVGLLGAVLWTVFSTKEYSPAQIAAFDGLSESDPAPASPPRSARLYGLGGAVLVALGAVIAAVVYSAGWEKELYVLAGAVGVFGALQLVVAALRHGGRSNGLTEILDDVFAMPDTMKGLAVVQFFSWFALFSMWIYTTATVTSIHYGSSDPTTAAYNAGADWVGILFGVYNGVAALSAFAIPVLAKKTGKRGAHAINLVLGGLGLISLTLIKDPALLWLPMIGVGFAWASILSMPYAILSGALPGRKMGVYMGIFNIFIVVPQLLAATILGLILKNLFGGQAVYALMIGGVSFFIAAACALLVKEMRPSAT